MTQPVTDAPIDVGGTSASGFAQTSEGADAFGNTLAEGMATGGLMSRDIDDEGMASVSDGFQRAADNEQGQTPSPEPAPTQEPDFSEVDTGLSHQTPDEAQFAKDKELLSLAAQSKDPVARSMASSAASHSEGGVDGALDRATKHAASLTASRGAEPPTPEALNNVDAGASMGERAMNTARLATPAGTAQEAGAMYAMTPPVVGSALAFCFNDRYRTAVVDAVRGGTVDENEPPSPPLTNFLPTSGDSRDESIVPVDQRITRYNKTISDIDPADKRLWDDTGAQVTSLTRMTPVTDEVNALSGKLDSILEQYQAAYRPQATSNMIGDSGDSMRPHMDVLSSFGDEAGKPIIENTTTAAATADAMFQAVRDANAKSRHSIATSRGKYFGVIGNPNLNQNKLTDNGEVIRNHLNEFTSQTQALSNSVSAWQERAAGLSQGRSVQPGVTGHTSDEDRSTPISTGPEQSPAPPTPGGTGGGSGPVESPDLSDLPDSGGSGPDSGGDSGSDPAGPDDDLFGGADDGGLESGTDSESGDSPLESDPPVTGDEGGELGDPFGMDPAGPDMGGAGTEAPLMDGSDGLDPFGPGDMDTGLSQDPGSPFNTEDPAGTDPFDSNGDPLTTTSGEGDPFGDAESLDDIWADDEDDAGDPFGEEVGEMSGDPLGEDGLAEGGASEGEGGGETEQGGQPLDLGGGEAAGPDSGGGDVTGDQGPGDPFGEDPAGDPAGEGPGEGDALPEESPWGPDPAGGDAGDDPAKTVEVNGEPQQFVNEQTADIARDVLDPATDQSEMSFRDLASQHGFDMPDEGQDIGAAISPSEIQPGDVIASDDGKYYMFVGGEDVIDTETGDTHPIADVAHFSGEHEGVFRLDPGDGSVAAVGGSEGADNGMDTPSDLTSDNSPSSGGDPAGGPDAGEGDPAGAGGGFERTDTAPIGMGDGQNEPGSGSGSESGGLDAPAAGGDKETPGGITETDFEGEALGGETSASPAQDSGGSDSSDSAGFQSGGSESPQPTDSSDPETTTNTPEGAETLGPKESDPDEDSGALGGETSASPAQSSDPSTGSASGARLPSGALDPSSVQ